MDYSSTLACTTFVDTDLDIADLVAWIGARVNGATAANTVTADLAELDIRKNDGYDAARRVAFPDGFLSFRYRIEVFGVEGLPSAQTAPLVGRLLEQVWAEGWPAVAACDFEGQLPYNGGYKSREVPWRQAGVHGEDG